MDQLMSCYSPLPKTLKWYRKVVLQHLDMALKNTFIVYKKNLDAPPKSKWSVGNVSLPH